MDLSGERQMKHVGKVDFHPLGLKVSPFMPLQSGISVWAFNWYGFFAAKKECPPPASADNLAVGNSG